MLSGSIGRERRQTVHFNGQLDGKPTALSQELQRRQLVAGRGDDRVDAPLTTHQLDEAQQICDRIVIMDGGRTIASGTVDQLLENSIGRRRRLVLALPKPAENRGKLLDGFQWRDDRTAVSEVDDVVTELPARLKTLSASGLDVGDLSIETPSLQSVFLHYTGHELRESGSLS